MLATALTIPKLDAAAAMETTPVIKWVRIVLLPKVVALDSQPVIIMERGTMLLLEKAVAREKKPVLKWVRVVLLPKVVALDTKPVIK